MTPCRALGATLALLMAEAMTACALINPPPPLTTVQLHLANQTTNRQLQNAWPDTLVLEVISADTAFAGNRVIVLDGAKVMQFAGLRWLDSPAVMLREQLELRQARIQVKRPPLNTAFVQLAINDFSIHLHANSDRLLIDSFAGANKTVVVSIRARMRCASTASIQELGIFSSKLPLHNTDAQSVAATFATASEDAVNAMLSKAKLALPLCQFTKHS